MSNEEKAKEIAELNGICYKNHSKYESDMDSTLECYGSAIQMAEWKDEQFRQMVKNYIELAYSNGDQAHLLEDLLKDI